MGCCHWWSLSCYSESRCFPLAEVLQNRGEGQAWSESAGDGSTHPGLGCSPQGPLWGHSYAFVGRLLPAGSPRGPSGSSDHKRLSWEKKPPWLAYSFTVGKPSGQEDNALCDGPASHGVQASTCSHTHASPAFCLNSLVTLPWISRWAETRTVEETQSACLPCSYCSSC